MTTASDAAEARAGEAEGDLPDLPNGASGDTERHDRWVVMSVVAAIGVAAVVLWREAETEPYHIDELRQVRPYELGLDRLLEGSWAQEQPPLDVVVGAGFQRVLGVGDVLQRGHSMLAGVVALVCLAVLLWRHRVRFGIPIAMLVLALLPAFISMTAYARPYALPLALMLGFLLAVDAWLARARWWSAIACVVVAGLLPLSRVFEPPAFLVLVAATVLVARRRHPDWGPRVWLPVASAVAAIVLVEIPVYVQLQDRLTAYQGEGPASIGEQWRRILDDSLPRLADVFVNWWLAVLLVGVAVAMPTVRRRLISFWWFWPLVLTPIAFFVAFHMRTQPGQPFYDRYGYFWLPPFAIVLGLLAESLRSMLRRHPFTRPTVAAAWVVAVLFVAYGVQLGVAIADDLRTSARDDYRSLGREIETRLPLTTAVVFDAIDVPLGSYRSDYAGYGRYTSPERRIHGAEALAMWPDQAADVERYVIATNGAVLAVDGWEPVQASPTMTLYLPQTSGSGPAQLAADLVRFGEALDPSRGATLRLAGAQILFEIGDHEAGCAVIGRFIAEEPSLRSAVRAFLDRSANAVPATQCLDDQPG